MSGAQSRMQVFMACGRIAGSAAAIVSAHALGIPEGPHERPWTPGYHRDAVHVYAESLPSSYQSDVAALFGRSARTMAGCSIPARLAGDWVIVAGYLEAARAAILEDLARREPNPHSRASASGLRVEQQDAPPMVIHFDALARLTTQDGARRSERAALAVRQHMETPMPLSLDADNRHLLKRVAAGVPVADIAEEAGYSERTMYRALSRLWDHLGVQDRAEGLRRATEQGLLD